MTITLKPRQAITNAPVDYDYGWMKTVVDHIAEDDKGRPCRLVENDDDWHFEQQLMRYGSGLNIALSEQRQVEDFLQVGYLKLTPEKAVRIHRLQVDMTPAMEWDRQDRVSFIANFLGEMKRPGSDTTYDHDHGINYYFTARGDIAFEALKANLAQMELTWEPWGPQHEDDGSKGQQDSVTHSTE